MTRDEAAAIRDYLFFGDPALATAPETYVVTPPKILDREVKWEETKARTIGKVCVHCHMNDYEKDTGPGNKGGFGYHGIGLRMRTYEALVEGAVGADGKRYSVLVPRPGEAMAPILASMMQRRVEEQRDHVAAGEDYERPNYPSVPKHPLGMPMGLPSMTDEEMSILATWISQGCKGPTAVWGKPGVNDGLFVPDGPLKKTRAASSAGRRSHGRSGRLTSKFGSEPTFHADLTKNRLTKPSSLDRKPWSRVRKPSFRVRKARYPRHHGLVPR